MQKSGLLNRSMNVHVHKSRTWIKAAIAALPRCCLLVAAAGLIAACANTKDEEENKPAAAPNHPKIVGRIASIPPGNSYVLIQSFGDWTVPTGTVLTTRGQDERAANLLVTGEKLGQFAAADIQSGDVKVGDAVLMLPGPSPQPEPAPPGETADAPPPDGSGTPTRNQDPVD